MDDTFYDFTYEISEILLTGVDTLALNKHLSQ